MRAKVDTCNFDEIDEAGAYVENRFGTLFRLPEDAIPKKRLHTPKRTSRERWPVTRVSRNPNVPLEVARKLAANLGVKPKF